MKTVNINGITVKAVSLWNELPFAFMDSLRNANFLVEYSHYHNHFVIYGIKTPEKAIDKELAFFEIYDLMLTVFDKEMHFFLLEKAKLIGRINETNEVLIPFMKYILPKIDAEKFSDYTFVLHEGTE